jgi:hypothetical protein
MGRGVLPSLMLLQTADEPTCFAFGIPFLRF